MSSLDGKVMKAPASFPDESNWAIGSLHARVPNALLTLAVTVVNEDEADGLAAWLATGPVLAG
jgi:hypothetical protein